MFAHEVYKTLKNLLDAAHLSYAPIKSTIATHSDIQKIEQGLTLFEYMTLTDEPEIRAQEAIFPHLIAAGYQTQREKWQRFGNDGRKFDFVVSNGENEVIIEIKHRSPHQTNRFHDLIGPVITKAGEHLGSLHQDFYKARPANTPFIQLGLYTAVEDWIDICGERVSKGQSGSKFVERYAKPIEFNDYKDEAYQQLNAWELRDRFLCPDRRATAEDFCKGQDASYKSPTNVAIRGRVNYFLGIADPL